MSIHVSKKKDHRPYPHKTLSMSPNRSGLRVHTNTIIVPWTMYTYDVNTIKVWGFY